MPFFGGGLLHLVIAGFFAVHVVRTGREYYWLYILFGIPYVGSAVYFFAVYLPQSRLHHDVRRAASATARVLDPGRELRDAEKAFDLAPTAQNQMRLAAALLEAGDYAKAAEYYEACLRGPFASDPVIRLGAARARMQNGQNAIALELLESIRKQTPDFRPEQTIVALAKAYADAGRHGEARDQFLAAVNRFASVESRAEYAIWALSRGDLHAATEQQQEIERAMKYWNKYNREMHRQVMKRLDAAFAAARQS